MMIYQFQKERFLRSFYLYWGLLHLCCCHTHQPKASQSDAGAQNTLEFSRCSWFLLDTCPFDDLCTLFDFFFFIRLSRAANTFVFDTCPFDDFCTFFDFFFFRRLLRATNTFLFGCRNVSNVLR